MSFRDYLKKIEGGNKLQKVSKTVSKRLEASGVLKALEPKPVLFEKIEGSAFKVAGNVFPTKDSVAEYLECTAGELIPRISSAIKNMKPPEEASKGACQEVVEETVDSDKLPILFHCEHDGGNYVSSGVMIARDADYGQNMDFHRLMQIGKNKFSVRVVKERHFDKFLKKNGQMDVAVCVGNGANVLVAAATSIELGQDELGLANALKQMSVVKAKSVDVNVPAECEFVLEGTVALEEKHAEGPFVDLTETLDVVRQEPVFTVKKITHRKDAVWQALLPGALEHKVLMGMPREPTIFKKVNEAGVKCLDVNVNPGGCSWLHAIVKIKKQKEDDGKKAIYAAFEGHKSCKHIFIVDEDIGIYNPLDVEWAMATRFQADEKLVVKPREKGSSLDPSAEPETHATTKCGFDCTKPLVAKGKNFEKEQFPKIDVKKYL
ncbi:UbiD family decarboxylase [Candidatus Micrarchaeota archaeon]|nr:UbiD family decarboxylase [Candidatus Micrarchaeota archaeon]